MKKIICLLMSLISVISVLSISFSAIAQEIEKNNALVVSEKVSAMQEKYDTEIGKQLKGRENGSLLVDERLIVKSNSKINTYDAVESVYGLGYSFIQFENDKDAEKAFEAYEQQGYAVQYDYVFSYCNETGETTIPSTIDENWAYEMLEIPETLEYFKSANKNYEDVTVGILDSGVDYTHDLFDNRITRTDLNFGSSSGERDSIDTDGHGTSVAGIIALSTPDNVKIEPYKLVGNTNKVYTSSLMCCLEYILAMPDPPDVLNMSIGISDVKNEINVELFEKLVKAGITICVSAGNSSTKAEFYKPAGIKSVITVSASDEDNNRCSWSNFGNLVDIAAPGNETIYTAKIGGEYRSDFGGTSASSPFVSAAAAIVLMQNKELSPTEVENELKETAVPIQKKSDLEWCGAGLVNFYSLIDQPKINDVTFSYVEGDYDEPIAVELSCDTPNSKIIYTTDMTVPSLTNGNAYSEPIDITEHTNIIAVAYNESENRKSNYTSSEYRIIYEADESDFEISLTGAITAYNGEHKSIIVPNEINGIIPTMVGTDCFREDKNIEYIVLPESVDIIQMRAFRESSLQAIIAPGVIDACAQSFMYCEQLYYEYMPKIQYVSKYAFYYCSLMSDFTFKENIITAEYSCFSHTSLLEAVFPNLELEENAFDATPCYTAYLPKITELNGGFEYCYNLESIYIPNVTTISNYAFGRCYSLRQEEIDFSQFTSVGKTGFGRSEFESIILPNCTEVGERAFAFASSKHISVPNAKTVGESAFLYTYYLEEVNLESVEYFYDEEDHIFCDAVELKYLYIPNALNIPTFEWQQALSALENNTSEAKLEFIYAPKATKFCQEFNDMKYFYNLDFIYAPNLKNIELQSMFTFPTEHIVTLYFTNALETASLNKPNLRIVAPKNSCAHKEAVENGLEFIPSDSMAETIGRSICSSVAGLRFGFKWGNIDQIEILATDIEYGFIYSQKGSQDLSIKTVDNTNVKRLIANNRITNENNTSFNLVISNIPNAYIDREITARAYVCIDGMYFYSDTLKGSFSEVANLVLADDEIDQNTKNAVKNLLEV